MSQSVITLAFERWKASATEAQEPVILDEFVLANIPNLDTSKPIDRNEGLPDVNYIVHRQAVNKVGVVNQNAVAYSVTIGADIGDFDFNWIGLLNKKSGTVAMIVHAPTQRKIKNQAGEQGNVLTRSFLLEYLGASKETAINTPAEMWQIDFTARLSGIDEMQRLINIDSYGEASFFGSSFLVSKEGNQYFVTKGMGYIGGLRAQLADNKNITVPAENTKVWVDVSYQGNITSRWQTFVQLVVKADLKNYIDNGGFPHFVFAIASISADGKITDLRPKGSLDFQQLDDALKKHEQSRNHPDATLTAKGFTQLADKTGTSSTLVPTQKLVTDLNNAALASAKSANDNANTRLPSTGTAVASQKLATPRKISGVLFDGTKDIALSAGDVGASTPAQVNEAKTMATNAQNTANSAVTKADNAQKTANDGVSKANAAQTSANNANNNANGRVPNGRKVNGKTLSSDVTITSQDIFDNQSINITGNLNDYQKPGIYFQSANANTSAALNYPENQAGSLVVLKNAGITQRYFIYNSSRVYTRSIYLWNGQGGWTRWAREYNTENKPSLSEIGASPINHDHNYISYQGAKMALTNTATSNISGLSFHGCYSNGYPTSYGNVLHLNGGGKGELLIGWSGTSGANAPVYVRSKRDMVDASWSPFAMLYSTAFKPTPADVGTYSKGEIDDKVLLSCPVGTPIPWPQSTAPSGYLICNGQTFNKSTYPKLATAYPSGKLPDLRGEFIRGLDSGRNIDKGRTILSNQVGQAPVSAIRGYWDSSWNNGQQRDTGYKTATGTNNGAWSGIYQETESQRETRPRNIAFLYIVRAA